MSFFIVTLVLWSGWHCCHIVSNEEIRTSVLVLKGLCNLKLIQSENSCINFSLATTIIMFHSHFVKYCYLCNWTDLTVLL